MTYVKMSRIVTGLFVVLGLCGGAMAAGLPGEYLVTQRWRALHNPYSPLSNPANIAEENYISVRGTLAPILQGAFTLAEFGVNVPLGLYQTAGFTLLTEGAGLVFEDVPNDQSGRLEAGTVGLGNTNLMFSFSYAYHIWQHLIIGGNMNIAYQTNFGEPLKGIGFDVGAAYRLFKHPLFGEHIVGLATQNLIAPTMGHSWVPDFQSAEQYARNLRLSGYSRFWENRIENYIDLDIKDFVAAGNNFTADVDFLKRIEWDLNWRVGYWAMRMFKAYLMFEIGDGEGWIDGWGLALGAQLPSFNSGRDMAAFYQYNVMTEESSDATSHSIYVKVDFGKHREEIYARKMARLASLNPNELYNRGRRLYAEGKYWDAFFVFSRLASEFPDFFRNDWVHLLRASCQEHLDMRDQAIANYTTRVKEAYPNAEVVPHADLGLMRIHYRNRDFPAATNQFVELNKPRVPDSLRFHGAYIMGQIFLQNGELRKAIHSFSVIPDGHPDYIHAQHATAVAHAVLDSDSKEIVTALENVINQTPRTPDEREIINRSYLFLGLLFYEEGALGRAVTALRQVPNNSYFTEDAQLGLGWSALKARQWSDCISVGQQLSRTSQKPILRAEGMLIEAYGHLMQKNYTRALDVIRAGYNIAQTIVPPNEDSLAMRKARNENSRATYSQMSDRVEEISLIGQTAHLAGQLDSMRNRSTNYINEFRDFHVFTNEFQRSSFFVRPVEQVKSDLEYAFATVQKIVGATTPSGAAATDARQQQQMRELDAEIQRLQQGLEGATDGGTVDDPDDE